MAAQGTDPRSKASPTLYSDVLCEGCGNRFQPRRRDQRHCRAACRDRAYQRRIADAYIEPDPGRPD
jgi:hypothetical protein